VEKANSIASFKDLIVWQKARLITKSTYELCLLLPKDELFGLSNQMKRSSVSIASNIAEDYRRNNRKEYIQFLGIASGSSAELETQLILVSDLFNIDTNKQQNDIIEIQKILSTMIKKLKN